MGYRVVKGKFHLYYADAKGTRRGSEPDGDSLWFEPARPKLLADLGGVSARFNKGGFVQLRFEGIDALELHYAGERQRAREALGARDALLGALGFGVVTFAPPGDAADPPRRVREVAAPHPVPGYILTRGIDSPLHGRPVAFAFAGRTEARDGSEVQLGVSRLRRSLNAKLMAGGHVYAMYYASSLPVDLREALTALLKASPRTRLWAADRSMRWTAVAGLSDLLEVALWPKLFRRLVSFFKGGGTSLAGFDAWLRKDKRDRDDALFMMDTGEFGNMHDVVEVKSGRIRMKYRPETLLVMSEQKATIDSETPVRGA